MPERKPEKVEMEMTDKQQEAIALRLADELEEYVEVATAIAAAAELRRLHNKNEALKRVIENCKVVSDATAEGWRHDQAKFDTTAALNAELLEALKKLEYSSDGYIKRYPEEAEVNAVIAKAEGKQ